MINSFSLSFSSYLKAFKCILRLRYFKYILLSGVISVILAALIFKGIYGFSDGLGDWIASFYKFDFGKGIINTIADWFVRIIMLVFSVMIFRYIVFIVSSPILSIISESLELEMTGRNQKALSWRKHLASLRRGFRISVRNLSKELFLTLTIIAIGIFTGISFLVTPLLFLIQAYYSGVGNYDFLLERKFDVANTHSFNRENRTSLIMNGSLFLLLLSIPVVGIIFAPALAVIAATYAGLQKLEF